MVAIAIGVEIEAGVTTTIELPRSVPSVFKMDLLTLYGVFAVSAMMVFYALEDRGAIFVLAFAGACLLASVYGFLQGAWPFGVVEAVWALVAVRRWWRKVHRTL